MAPVTRSHVHSAEDANPEGDIDTASRQSESRSYGGRLRTRQVIRTTKDASPEAEDDDTDDTDDEEDDEEEGPVRSPLTSLFYNIDGLDDETQELVRELFRPPAPEETPPIVIEWCGISNDPDVYAFQLQEIVPRTIRIGSATSRIPKPSCNCTGSENKPCRHLVWLMDQIAKQTMAHGQKQDSSTETKEGDYDRPLELDPTTAFPRELGNAYARISDFHIGILASSLHCRAEPPNGRPDSHRVREAREILAGLQGVQDDAGVDAYASEIFDLETPELERLLWGTQNRQGYRVVGKDSNDGSARNASSEDEEMGQDEEDLNYGREVDSVYDESDRSQGDEDVKETVEHEDTPGRHHTEHTTEPPQRRSQADLRSQHQQVRDLVERGDLQQTVLRLLVSNDEFFSMFLKLLAPQDKVRDPFRKIQQRIESVLGALRAARTTGEPRQSAAGEVISAEWAAKHVHSAVHQIMHLLGRCLSGARHGEQEHPASWAKAGAARAILWMMTAIVSKHTRDAHAGASQDDRNLYQRVIGNSGHSGTSGDALLDALDAVHDQVQFLSQVERIRRRIQRNGYRESYMQRLDGILQRMRKIRDGSDEPRQSGAGHRSISVAGSKRPQPPSAGSEQRSKRPR
ncbi:swim zinc finger protein [Ophiostoma piceae UAMH 11346]|uniref:Swim zinc finger protein n=1 Tax=Ophiostoma piceae (strain UAMH 11346) TaxID=1262450 RepID=S3C670_OPHP1|nr:swim zinc finger protein [Ophiostoma piceae UAMH 11346]